MINAPDPAVIRLLVDDEPFDLTTACGLRFERVLDMRAGVLRREVEFATARGHRMLLRSRRLVSLEHRALAAMRYEVAALDAGVGVGVAIVSEVVTHDPRRTADDPRRGTGFADKPLAPLAARAAATRWVLHLTRHSGELACGIEHDIDAPSAWPSRRGRPATRRRRRAGDGRQVGGVPLVGHGRPAPDRDAERLRFRVAVRGAVVVSLRSPAGGRAPHHSPGMSDRLIPAISPVPAVGHRASVGCSEVSQRGAAVSSSV